MMDEETTNTYIGVTAGLLAVLLILTLILAAFVWFKSKQAFRGGNIRRKRPRLKINIKDVPKTKPQPPSAAYQILSTTDPPEFTIPPTPTLATPATPDSPITSRRLFHSSHTSLTSPTTPESPRLQHPSYRSPLASPNSQRKQTLPSQRISVTSLSAPGSSPNSPRDQGDSSQRPSVVSIAAPDSPRAQHPTYRSTIGSASSPNSPRGPNPPPKRISLSSSAPNSPREQSQPLQRPSSSPAPEPKLLRPPYKRSSSTSPPHIKVTSFAETTSPTSSSSPGKTPRNPLNSVPADLLYRRSASVPSEAFFSRDMGGIQEVDSSNLWRSAISKTVAANLLSRPLRATKKALYPTNGIIKFCLKYNPFDMELFIKVLDLIDLPLTREKGVSYPYVQVFILTDDESQKPLFYEVLNYTREKTCNFAGLPIEKVRASVLKFVVMDYDKFSRTEFVADIQLPLEYVNLEGEEETRPLSIINEEVPKEKGELVVSLCYQPNSSQVSVIVLKANALPEGPSGSRPDFFVKITLLRNGVVTDKRRTKVIKKTRCPAFNEKLVFPVDEHGLRGICLVFDVIHHESRLKQEKKGNVVIGNSYSQRAISPLELKHFHEMLESPQKQVAESHKIV